MRARREVVSTSFEETKNSFDKLYLLDSMHSANHKLPDLWYSTAVLISLHQECSHQSIIFYIIGLVMHAFWLVLSYDLMEDRRKADCTWLVDTKFSGVWVTEKLNFSSALRSEVWRNMSVDTKSTFTLLEPFGSLKLKTPF